MAVSFDFLNSIQYEKIKDVHGDTYELNDVNVSSLLESMCDIIITYITSNEYDTNSESYKNLLKWFASDKHIAPEFIKKLQENSIDPDTIPELKGQLKL